MLIPVFILWSEMQLIPVPHIQINSDADTGFASSGSEVKLTPMSHSLVRRGAHTGVRCLIL
jgi:hypothetical protein